MATTPKATKKLPKWVFIGVGVAVLALIIIERNRRKTTEATNATEPGSQGLTNQSFIPVVGENTPGAGASFGGSSGEQFGNISQLFSQEQEQTREYMREQKQESKEQRAEEHAWLKEIIGNLGTGGGAPTGGTPPGVTPAPPPPGATPGPGTPPVITGSSPQPKTSGESFKTIKCGNGCEGHQYKTHTECQVKTGGKCHWP